MLLAKNRKALFRYELIEKYIAGIVLKGYEVKAIREGNANFEGSFVRAKEGELYVTGMFIGRYSKQSKDFNEVAAARDRKLLLNKREIVKLMQALTKKGFTAVPLALVLRNNLIKLEFGLVRGKKDFEKKVVVKERQLQRDLESQTKEALRN